jgi:hypothetical protein
MGTPPILSVMAALVLLALIHELWPELIPAYLGLIVLYLVLTHVEATQQLLRAGPAALARLLAPQPSSTAPAGGGGRPAQLVSA